MQLQSSHLQQGNHNIIKKKYNATKIYYGQLLEQHCIAWRSCTFLCIVFFLQINDDEDDSGVLWFMSGLVVFAKWTEWMAKNRRRHCSRSMSVHLCAEERPITVIKRLKLWSWNLTWMCPQTVQTWNLKNFSKRGVARVMWPTNFW